jgi:hypothetical protein
MKPVLVFSFSIVVLITFSSSYVIKPSQDDDPKNSIRINEVSLDVGKTSYTTFMFVEIFTSMKNVDVTGVTVVIYGGSKQEVLVACPCTNAFNDQGFAQCICGTELDPFKTQEFIGAVSLHNADQTNFPVGAPASTSSKINLIDAVLWQSYGAVLVNPLQSYFAQGQVYHYTPPAKASAYSINRCYGDPLTNQRWQASFSWNETATPNAPNVCLPPVVIINEINFNKPFIELMSSPELPLDSATVAFVQEKDSSATIINVYSLLNQRIESSTFFTMGKLGSDLVIPGWTMPSVGSVAVVVYFDIIIQPNMVAPSSHILHSLVYGDANGQTTPALQAFGAKTYAYDPSGKCSLAVCNGNILDIQLAMPSFDAQNDCNVQCSP